MPTKLEQLAAIMAGMTTLELDTAKALAQVQIDKAPKSTDCKLLNLPAELRDLIYYFAAIMHLHAYGNTKRCGLLSANKQVRAEFMDILYSKQTAKLSFGKKGASSSRGLRFDRPADHKALKKVLDGGDDVAKISGFIPFDEIRTNYKNREVWGLPQDPVFALLTLVLADDENNLYALFNCEAKDANEKYGQEFETREDREAGRV